MNAKFNTLYLDWSIREMPKSQVNGYEKAILQFLRSASRTNNESWYSQESIAEKTCFSLNTIKRNLKTLKQKNLIKVTTPDKHGRGNSNRYELNIDLIMNFCPVETNHKGVPTEPLSNNKGGLTELHYSSHRATERGPDRAIKKENKERKEEGTSRAPSEARESPSFCREYTPAELAVRAELRKQDEKELRERDEYAKQRAILKKSQPAMAVKH